MRKPPTGEPCAGEPHARFGGRGGATLPDPYLLQLITGFGDDHKTKMISMHRNNPESFDILRYWCVITS